MPRGNDICILFERYIYILSDFDKIMINMYNIRYACKLVFLRRKEAILKLHILKECNFLQIDLGFNSKFIKITHQLNLQFCDMGGPQKLIKASYLIF